MRSLSLPRENHQSRVGHRGEDLVQTIAVEVVGPQAFEGRTGEELVAGRKRARAIAVEEEHLAGPRAEGDIPECVAIGLEADDFDQIREARVGDGGLRSELECALRFLEKDAELRLTFLEYSQGDVVSPVPVDVEDAEPAKPPGG